jgi:hypothetical protein
MNTEAEAPIPIDIKIKKQANGMWRADLSGHMQKEILYFYDKSPVGAADKAIEYIRDLGEIVRTDLIVKGGN